MRLINAEALKKRIDIHKVYSAQTILHLIDNELTIVPNFTFDVKGESCKQCAYKFIVENIATDIDKTLTGKEQ